MHLFLIRPSLLELFAFQSRKHQVTVLKGIQSRTHLRDPNKREFDVNIENLGPRLLYVRTYSTGVWASITVVI